MLPRFNPPDYPPPRRDGSSRLWPCAIVSSGGAYEGISVAEARHGTGWLASLGVVAFALRYRLPPKHPWPAARDDVAAAVEFLRSPAAAAKFRVDRDRLVLLGFSAGSHLSAHALGPGVRAAVLVYPAWADAKDDQGRLVRTADHAEREARKLGDDRALLPDAVWKSNLQPDFNVRVIERFGPASSAVLRERDESNRSVQKSAESTSI